MVLRKASTRAGQVISHPLQTANNISISISIYLAHTYSSSDAIRGATRGPVLLVHVMAEVKCLEMIFKNR